MAKSAFFATFAIIACSCPRSWSAIILYHLLYPSGGDLVFNCFFLREGADVDFKGYGSQTPLLLLFRHYGSGGKRFSRKRLKLLKLLLEHGADVNVKTRDGWTPLIFSAWKGSTDAAELILQNGPDIEGRDIWGRTALTFGNENMISLLVERGADINTRDNRGSTPVIEIAASRFEKTDKLKFLIKMGADLNLKDDEGRTALMEAASNKIVGINSVSERFSGYIWQSEAVKLLLDGGANPNARNKAGKTVLMIAASEWQLGRSRDYYEKQLQVVKMLPNGNWDGAETITKNNCKW